MAENKDDDNGAKNYFKSSKKISGGLISDDESDDSVPKPDIGLGYNNIRCRKFIMDNTIAGSSSSDVLPRRDENPFSFTHFLNPEGASSLSTGGARPKVFSSAAVVSPSDSEHNAPSSRLVSNPELASGLPDFVQDHLVIEQCYLSDNDKGVPAHLAVDLDHLPDFAPTSNEDQWSPSRQISPPTGDIPFDLTANRRERRLPNDAPVVLPLDLPESFPFDLPAAAAAAGEVGASKSLPDFLSDGPIHSERRNDNTQPPSEDNSPNRCCPAADNRHSPRLQMENERLRRELDTTRRQLIDQVRKNELLEAELSSLRNRDYEDTSGLEKMMEQVEDNLKRATRRAVNAESRVSKLKQEIKLLTTELNEARGQQGTSTSRGASSVNANPQRLACELRAAASSAEVSLRQLLNGVDNLRLMASTLECRHRVVDHDPADLELESDSINESAGPAL